MPEWRLKSDHWLWADVEKAHVIVSNIFDCMEDIPPNQWPDDDDITALFVRENLEEIDKKFRNLQELLFELKQDEERYPDGSA